MTRRPFRVERRKLPPRATTVPPAPKITVYGAVRCLGGPFPIASEVAAMLRDGPIRFPRALFASEAL